MKLNILLIFLLFILVACESERKQAIEQAPLISIRIPDENGKEMIFPDPPKRIVSLAPSMTEMMFAIGESKRLIAVSQACDFPKEAQLLQQVTTFPELDRETLLSLQTDCILATSEIFSPAQVLWFRQQGIPVIFQSYPNLESIWSGIEQLGILSGSSDFSFQIGDSLRKETHRIKQEQKTQQSIVLLVNASPLMIVGKGGYLNDLLETAGGQNPGSAFNRAYVEVDAEFLLKNNPDFILIPAKDELEALAFLQKYPQLSGLKAVQGKRLFRVDPSIYLRPGPRSIQALQEVYSILHPGGNSDE
jgi:iron complex transport system substrate-binding protein